MEKVLFTILLVVISSFPGCLESNSNNVESDDPTGNNDQSNGLDTSQTMSAKISIISLMINSIEDSELHLTFELAPGSESINPLSANWTVICDDNNGSAEFSESDFSNSKLHNEENSTETIEPGTTYVLILELMSDTDEGCKPKANTDDILVISVEGGGSTYETLQYGNSPQTGDVLV